MTDAESALNLKSDESDVAAFLEERGGKLIPDESDNGMYWLLLRPSSDQSQEYVACVRWDRYRSVRPASSSQTRSKAASRTLERGRRSRGTARVVSTFACHSRLRGLRFTLNGIAAHNRGAHQETLFFGSQVVCKMISIVCVTAGEWREESIAPS